jgi:hypothetical protein
MNGELLNQIPQWDTGETLRRSIKRCLRITLSKEKELGYIHPGGSLVKDKVPVRC